jgi:hypothetical protein
LLLLSPPFLPDFLLFGTLWNLIALSGESPLGYSFLFGRLEIMPLPICRKKLVFS